MVEVAQIVGAHDPGEVDARIARLDQGQRVGRVAQMAAGLEGGHLDARIAGDVLGMPDALGERHQLTRVLQGIAGRDDPPELIQR